MTPTDTMALAALFCCGVGIAGVLWGMRQHRRRLYTEGEVRRLRDWGNHWNHRALEFYGQIISAEKARKLSASHARQCQIAQQKARKAETTQRLERGE